MHRLSLNGDILRWDREVWELRSPLNRSDLEIVDFERDVCANSDNGLLMVPQKMSFGESVHTCKKLSGNVITYKDKSRQVKADSQQCTYCSRQSTVDSK